LHELQSPTTPYSIVEFQGGSFDPWEGPGFAKCTDLLNYEFERVFYKNDYSFGVTIFNIYMTYGGTNWGNLGHPGGYTSYDYGAAISEERLVTREKYSEAKLEANFLMASPAYLTATPGNNTNANGSYTNSDALAVTPLFGDPTTFFVLRHAAYNSLASTKYKLVVPTSMGTLTIPQLGGQLTLNGRDSKIHVTDYDVGGQNLLYSSAEIFTWKKDSSKTVLIVYGGPGEHHEMGFSNSPSTKSIEGSGVQIGNVKGATVINWQTSPTRRVIKVGTNLFVYLLNRNAAYNYWVLPLPSLGSSIVARAGYLLRNATITGRTLSLTGDLNATTSLEIIVGAPANLLKLNFNGISTTFKQNGNGVVSTILTYVAPQPVIPALANLDWKYIDSLPEIQNSYDDSAWTNANQAFTLNPDFNLSTPTSLFASDYGYNTGTLLYRGHFVATGSESSIFLYTQGGTAFGMSAWLNSTYIGSWAGVSTRSNNNSTFTLPNVQAGQAYVLTVVIDNMGLDENFFVGDSGMKNPRGILNYSLAGRPQNAISWKLTGNLGGEQYRDLTRGPLNEGGMYAERQGFHLPQPPSSTWISKSPSQGLSGPGIGFFATSFNLNLPRGYDIPLSVDFGNSTASGSAVADYRVQLFVNGYQFGKYG